VSYSADLIRLIDERIALSRRQDRAQGTVVARDTTGPGAMVVFDGSTTPVPVKCAGNVFTNQNDRVLLARHGSDWIVTESFSSNSFGEASKHFSGGLGSTSGNLTSATYVDLTEFGTIQFTKAFDLTYVQAQVTVGGYATAIDTRAAWALRYTPVAGAEGYTPTDITMAIINWDVANVHRGITAMGRVISLPAGTYTVSLRWRRTAGSGNVVANNNDEYAVAVDEHPRANVPIL
jgi:hypothetical protein